MEKIYLDTLHINPYNEKAACAYVYYGKENQPKDHKERTIGPFYQHSEELRQHLNDFVLPKIQSRLTKFGYRIQCVDFLNQAPHPFFSIVKGDGKDFTKNDLQDMDEKLKGILDSLNKKSKSFFASTSQDVHQTEEKLDSPTCRP